MHHQKQFAVVESIRLQSLELHTEREVLLQSPPVQRHVRRRPRVHEVRDARPPHSHVSPRVLLGRPWGSHWTVGLGLGLILGWGLGRR